MADMKSIKFPGSDTVYTPVDQVARDEAAKKLNSDQLPTAINEALAQAKESGDFNGAPGSPGKTAYQYAQDGGYTGSEEDFAKKLAAEWQGKLTGTQGQVVGFDAEGNAVAQEAPEGGSSIPTVKVGGDTITWDGNTEGKVFGSLGAEGNYIKVSDATPVIGDFANGGTATINGELEAFTAEQCVEMGILLITADVAVIVVPPEYAGIDLGEGDVFPPGSIFPEAGVYFGYVPGAMEASSLTIPGYTGFAQEKIAPAYLYQPDFAQTDESQPDAIKNLPFGDFPTGGDTLEWDGNTEGLVSVADMFYRVSDAEVAANDLANGCVATSRQSISNIVVDIKTFSASDVMEMAAGVTGVAYSIVCVTNEGAGVDVDGLVFPEPGIYLLKQDVYFSSLTIPGYTGFPLVKKLDEKFLPDSVKAQPDWNQNDETAADYVKNRTHYAEDGEITLIPEIEYTGVDEGGIYATNIAVFDIVESVIVVFDGVRYECEMWENDSGMYCYGNAALMGGGDTGEPFLIGLLPDNFEGVLGMTTAGTHTVGVFTKGIIYHKIAPEFVDAQKVFYFTYGSVYIYSDDALTVKATMEEVANACKNKTVFFQYRSAGKVLVQCYPVLMNFAQEYGIAMLAVNVGVDSISNWGIFYTAEYVAPTSE